MVRAPAVAGMALILSHWAVEFNASPAGRGVQARLGDAGVYHILVKTNVVWEAVFV